MATDLEPSNLVDVSSSSSGTGKLKVVFKFDQIINANSIHRFCLFIFDRNNLKKRDTALMRLYNNFNFNTYLNMLINYYHS